MRCITIARGACCGYVSLRTSLIAVALVDITLGAAALGIGIIAFTNYHLGVGLAAYTALDSVCLVLALLSLYAIAKAKLSLLRAYYLWKCMESCVLPLFEVLALSSTGSLDPAYYVLILAKAIIRVYFTYLVFSYH